VAARVVRALGFDVRASGLGKRQRPGNPRGKDAGIKARGEPVEDRATGVDFDELQPHTTRGRFSAIGVARVVVGLHQHPAVANRPQHPLPDAVDTDWVIRGVDPAGRLLNRHGIPVSNALGAKRPHRLNLTPGGDRAHPRASLLSTRVWKFVRGRGRAGGRWISACLECYGSTPTVEPMAPGDAAGAAADLG